MCPAKMMPKVLAVAAHPDDEILGCGATLARHARQGDSVHIVILAQGIFSRSDGTADAAALERLRRSARHAGELVGAVSVDLHDLPDNRMDQVAMLDLAKLVESALGRYQPSIVYTHFPGDLNIDHVRTSEAVAIACRPVPGSPVRSLRYFEVQSSTEWRPPNGPNAGFAPTLFVDVAATLNVKIDALHAYASEMRPFPHARSFEAVEHLARWRGAAAGLDAAEAFVLARGIEA